MVNNLSAQLKCKIKHNILLALNMWHVIRLRMEIGNMPNKKQPDQRADNITGSSMGLQRSEKITRAKNIANDAIWNTTPYKHGHLPIKKNISTYLNVTHHFSLKQKYEYFFSRLVPVHIKC